jgi:nitrogen fixation/metabolism regulation signal transduction histidine kinase
LARPRTIAIASVLWICLGAILILGTIYQLGEPEYAVAPVNPLVPLVLIALGGAFIWLAIRLRGGNTSARTALTVLGALSMLALWPALLVIPAMILQTRQSSRAWFHALDQYDRRR